MIYEGLYKKDKREGLAKVTMPNGTKVEVIFIKIDDI